MDAAVRKAGDGPASVIDGVDPHDYPPMKRLLSAISETGAEFEVVSRNLGQAVSVDATALLQRDASLGLTAPGLWSPNRHSRMVEALDGCMAVSLAREDDVRTVPAWTGCALDDDPWNAVIGYLAKTPCDIALADGQMLHLPVAIVNETRSAPSPRLRFAKRADHALKAIDLSALWAGPLCGGLLAAAGVKTERVILVGGAAANPAVQQIAAEVFGAPITVPAPGEYVANGAARQAASILLGSAPDWKIETLAQIPTTGQGPALAQYKKYANAYLG